LDELLAQVDVEQPDPVVAEALAQWGTRNDPHQVPWEVFVRVVAPHVAARCSEDPQGGLALRLAWRNRIWTTRDTLHLSDAVEGAPVPDALALAERGELEPGTADLVLNAAVRFIEHSLHELPVGVLCGMRGATPDELRAQLAWLDQVESLVRLLDCEAEHGDRLDHARFHTAAYLDYLESEHESVDFEAFLTVLAQGDPAAPS
jgi:hypothetical protein